MSRYVTQCVVSESLRLLVGGPQLGAWLCPRLRGGGGGGGCGGGDDIDDRATTVMMTTAR